jgi:hypothetical protein
MNLRALQKNLVVIIAGTVFIVALAGILWLWKQAADAKSQVVTQLEEQQTQLQQLRGLNPAPSNDNIEALKREREQVAKLYARLQEGTLRPPLTVTNLVRDIQFKQLLGETVARLAAQARNVVKTPENFVFGFSRYDAEFPCKAGAATPEDCKKTLALLGKQLLAIEKLSSLLVESRVEELTQIRRTEVDQGGANSDALDVPITTDPRGLYEAYPFELVFTCDTKALRAFLASLANTESLFAVRTVKIERTSTTVTTGGSAGAATGRPGEATPAAEPTRVTEHARINVVLRVDLVEFIQPAPATKSPS